MRDQEQVHVSIPTVEVTLNVLGESVTVKSAPNGQFDGVHRGQRVSGSSLERLRKEIENIETEASQKTERRRRLKEAAAQPEPALLYRSGTVQARNRRRRPASGSDVDAAAVLEPIHVRGVDQRSGLALIIRENGEKESMTWDLICRPLAGVERKKLLDLAEKEQRANKEIPTPTQLRDVLDKIPLTQVEATWDEFREVWVVKFDGDELVAEVGWNAREQLEARVLARLVVKHTPYKFTDEPARGKGGRTVLAARLVEYADEHRLYTYDNVYKTAAEVDAFDAAMRAATRASERREACLESLLIDRSQFTDDA